MNRIVFKICCFLVVATLCSCGPKKGIVTKKKDQKERVATSEKMKPSPVVVESQQPEEVNNIVIAKPSARIPKSNSAVDVYIANYANIAITEMRRYGIPASITLAQGILESGSGRGRLAVEANNHFGIKCHGWTGDRIYHDDDRSKECFRKYDDPIQSYEDHSKFLTQRGRYAFLFDLKEDDYRAWAKGLKKAGYATDRKYPKKLVALIEDNDLDQFDKEGLKPGRQKRKSPPKKKSEPVASATTGISTYVVKQGDTLFSLSRKFGMSVDQIKSLNGLSDNTINIGQTLKVSNK